MRVKKRLLLILLTTLLMMPVAAAQSRIFNLVDRELCLALEPSINQTGQTLESVLVRTVEPDDGTTIAIDSIAIQTALLQELNNVIPESLNYRTHPNCRNYQAVLVLDVLFESSRSFYVQLSVTDFSRRSYPAPVDLWRRFAYGFAPPGEQVESRLIPLVSDMLIEFVLQWQAAHPE